MKDEHVSGAARTIEISGKEFETFPLSDQDLDSLTQWIRYKINKDAETQVEFAGSEAEASRIREKAQEYGMTLHWWNRTGSTLLLNDPAGLAYTVFLMVQRKFKKPWFENKFGTASKITDEQLANRSAVQQAFLDQNIIEGGEDTEEPKDSSKNE